jgi:hypothetical protein
VGILLTTDPHKKLTDAQCLFDQVNRPLPAERLIRDAIAICEQNNDSACVADGWLTYGLFFKSDSVGRREKYYHRHGFHDRTATFDTRYEKSIEYLEKAAVAFFMEQRFEREANAYLHKSYALLFASRGIEACLALSKSLDSYKREIEVNRGAKPVPSRVSNYEEFLANEGTRIGCSQKW